MKRYLRKVCLVAFIPGMLLINACNTSKSVQIVENGKTDYIIVTGTNGVYDRFAVGEFQEIMKKSTGAEFRSVKADSQEASTADKRILIGDSPQLRELLGDKQVDGLKNLESLVTKRGDDIIIVGGGNNGTPYGVYSFLEKEIGYRYFIPEYDGQLIPAHKTMAYSGKEYRERPAFDLMRTIYMLPYYKRRAALFLYRNHGSINRCSKSTKLKGLLKDDNPNLDGGHGFHLYITTERMKNYYKWDEPKDYFKTNPDFFSMDKNGNRTEKLQLCFANPELRKELTKRIIERGKRKGGNGFLVLGANDWPGSFCYCPECKKLEEKYGCIAGPVYDYILELCPKLKKELPGIKISTLAYRKKQSEAPPINIEKMPDNWICDFAPVDDDQGQALDGPRNIGTLENLKKWNKIAKHISYWYYNCNKTAPFGIVERLQRDIKLMYQNGVRGAGICGVGTPGMNSLQDYLFLRLLLNPDQDAWQLTKEYTDFVYGPAAEDMRNYIRDLEAVWREDKKFIGLYGPGKTMMCYTPERLLKWQKMFDEMEKKVAGLKREKKYISIARWDVDVLCLDHYGRIKKKFPDWKTTPDDLIARLRKVPVPKQFYQHKLREHAETAYLVAIAMNKPIPAPLDKLSGEQIKQLPQCGRVHARKDPDAACGEANTQPFRDGQMEKKKKKIGFDIYDEAAKRLVKHGEIDASKCTPGKYELYFITKTIIPRGGLIAFDSWWGVSDTLAPYYPEGDEFREFEIWASLKFVGPSFGVKTEDNKDRMFCDRIFIVDRNAQK
jgi:hypothetical protein